jgi:hypothetical protein
MLTTILVLSALSVVLSITTIILTIWHARKNGGGRG